MYSYAPGEGAGKKREWVDALVKRGLRPIFIVHSWHNSKSVARLEEARLIGDLSSAGHGLFNEVRELDYTPRERKPVKDNLGRVYRSIKDAERTTGAPRKGIALTISGKQSLTKGLKFEWATLADIAKGVSQ